MGLEVCPGEDGPYVPIDDHDCCRSARRNRWPVAKPVVGNLFHVCFAAKLIKCNLPIDFGAIDGDVGTAGRFSTSLNNVLISVDGGMNKPWKKLSFLGTKFIKNMSPS